MIAYRKTGTPEERFYARVPVRPEGECWLFTRSPSGRNGYGSIIIEGKRIFAHRLSYRLFKGDIPASMCVCHSCDTPKCVNPDHLFLGTHQENLEDMQRKGRRAKGRKITATVKLREAQVIAIRKLWEERGGGVAGAPDTGDRTLSCPSIGKMYGVSGQNVRVIVQRKIWKHI